MYRDVTPLLAIDEDFDRPADAAAAVTAIRRGNLAIVASADAAVDTLVALGADRHHAAWLVGESAPDPDPTGQPTIQFRDLPGAAENQRRARAFRLAALHLQGQHDQQTHGNRGTVPAWKVREGDVIIFDPDTAVTNSPGFAKGDRLVVDTVVKQGPGRSAAGRATTHTSVGVIVNGKIGPTWRADTIIEIEARDSTRQFHLQGQHDQQTHGNRGGRKAGSGVSIEGVGDVDEYLAANPQLPDEPIFVWHGRLVDGLPPEAKHALLFEVRERCEVVDYIADGMTRWREMKGLPEPKVNIGEVPAPLMKGDAVARAFETAPDQGDDPRVQAAFDEFKAQSAEMYEFMTRPESEGGMGVTVTFWTNPDPSKFGDGPYPDATAQAEDLRVNKHIFLEAGLGGAHEATMTQDEYDRFRAVHDVFGHAGIGSGFDRHGEYQAYLAHASMYTGDGHRAMASEYHGVNTSVWGGEPGSPGTGKSVILPEVLIENPWNTDGTLKPLPDEEDLRKWLELAAALIAAAGQSGVAYLAEKAGIKHPFAQEYERSPFHFAAAPPSRDALRIRLRGALRIRLPEAFKYNPSQPREPAGNSGGGRWTSGGGSQSAGTGTKADPIRTSDVDVAAQALVDGKHVQLDHERKVSTLVKELAKRVAEARAAEKDPPNINLCNVSVPGTNLFCSESKGIPRVQMPQLSGVPTKGSKADGLPKDDRGEVNLGPVFVEHLQSKGVDVTADKIDARFLKASQNELVGSKVAGMAQAMEDGTMTGGSIFVTADDYVVDGHHRWAAAIATELGGIDADLDVNVIDSDIITTLATAYDFAEEWGIPPKAAKPDAFAARRFRFRMVGDSFHLQGRHDQKTHGNRRGASLLPKFPPDMLIFANSLGARVPVPTRDELLRYDPIPSTPDNESMLLKFLDGTGDLSPERRAVHDTVVLEVLTDDSGALHPPQPDGQRKALIMGGGPASGKSTAIDQGFVEQPPDAARVNPDDFKILLPEARGPSKKGKQGNGLADQHEEEWASIMHDESSYLGKRAIDGAIDSHMNLVIDKTSSHGGKAVSQIRELHGRGYDVSMAYVTTDVESAVQAARVRGEKDGRYVSEPIVRNVHDGANMAFLHVASEIDGIELKLVTTYPKNPDGSYTTPVLTAEQTGQGRIQVHSRPDWDAYVARLTDPSLLAHLDIRYDD